MNELDIETIYKANIGLAWYQLRKFKRENDVEAQSFAFEALYKAIVTFQPDKGSKFATYASVCIFNAIGSYTRKGMNVEHPISISTITHENLTIEDMLPSNADTEKEYIANTRAEAILKYLVLYAASMNSEATEQILNIWIKEDFVIGQQEIAERVGCSQAHVARTIKRARESLKKAMEGNYHERDYITN